MCNKFAEVKGTRTLYMYRKFQFQSLNLVLNSKNGVHIIFFFNYIFLFIISEFRFLELYEIIVKIINKLFNLRYYRGKKILN